MPAAYRLTRADFARMRGFKRLSGALFSLSWGVVEGRSGPAGACVISAKTAPRANTRNTVKRRCRSVLVPILESLKEPWVMVLHAKKGAASAGMDEIRAEILELIRRTSIRAQ